MTRAGRTTRLLASFLLLAASGCDTVRSNLLGGASDAPKPGTPGFVQGFLGAAVADEPTAALIARDVLAAGGSAADAAVAAGFMLSVTLPSRAGLGGGGACLAYSVGAKGPGDGAPEAIMFAAPASAAKGGDRPAAVPMLARGLFALHARYGRRPIEELIVAAEQQARFGVPTSRALAADIAVVAAPLAGDPVAAAIFTPGGSPLAAGATLRQPDLAATLAQLRVAGIGDLYQGAMARRFADSSALAGGPVTVADLRASLPHVAAPISFAFGRDQVAVPPDQGGRATQATMQALDAGDVAGAQARGLAAAGGAKILPASTTLVTLDRDGNAVVCALSMNNLFGTGRIAPGTGILLAASPAGFPPALSSIALATNTHVHGFRAAVGGSGQAAAAMAAALAMAQELREVPPTPAPDPGRANVIGCPGYIPGGEQSCAWRADPRGAGLAVGSAT